MKVWISSEYDYNNGRLSGERRQQKVDYEQVAASLYDGGWRTEDAEELQQEYALSDDELVNILKELEKLD